MNSYNFENKHIFFMNDADKFTNLFIDSLLNKLGMNSNDIVVVLFPINDSFNDNIEKIPYLKYFEYSDEILKILFNVKSLTFMSLNKWNATIIKNIINIGVSLDKIYIYITDDEISRWNSSYNKFSKLIENNNTHLSQDVLYVMKQLKNFIVPREYFYEILVTLLERDTFSIINASVIFDILPYRESNKLCSLLENKNIIKNEFKKVMIGTKHNSFSVLNTINILKSFSRLNLHSQYEFIYSGSVGRRILVDIYVLFVRKIKRQRITISYNSNMSSLLYNTLLGSITYIILQPRGGASSARLFIKWMCGHLLIPNASPNALFFEKVYKTDFIKFNHFLDIANAIVNKGNINLVKNKKAIIEEELRSIEELKKIYY